MSRLTLLVDFDNTLSDHAVFAPLYIEALAAEAAASYGGARDRWRLAVASVLAAAEAEYVARFLGNPLAGYAGWLKDSRETVAHQLFAAMEITPRRPAAGAAPDLQTRALRRCNALYPGALQALGTLRERGWIIHMASGHEERFLRGALEGAGLDGLVERYYGADLLDCAKEGPEYYARLLADCHAAAGGAVVIDDQAEALEWAAAHGIRGIQCMPEGRCERAGAAFGELTDWRQLPNLLTIDGG